MGRRNSNIPPAQSPNVGGNFVWTPPNYNYSSAYLIPSQVVIKQNIAVTKTYRLNYKELIS